MNHNEAKRRRMRQRRRRLFVLVVVVDLIGGAALAYAIARPTDHPRHHRRATAALVSHPMDPLTVANSATSTRTTAAPPARHTTAAKATRTLTAAAAAPPHPGHRPKTNPKPRQIGCDLNVAAARQATAAEVRAGYRVGFALMASPGRRLAAVNSTTPNYGASITKAMLLVAYLRDHAATGLDSTSISELSAMIDVSDNEAADWVYAHLSSPAGDVERVALDAGMSGFRLDTSDPVYTLGQSLVTAHDFARFFTVIRALMPPRYRHFGMGLLAHVQERVGLLAAGLPGTVYSKEGWKPESQGVMGAPYVVNQAARFSCRGVTYGLAVTVGQAQDQASAETVVQRIAGALLDY